jgi:hypothetical protein
MPTGKGTYGGKLGRPPEEQESPNGTKKRTGGPRVPAVPSAPRKRKRTREPIKKLKSKKSMYR